MSIGRKILDKVSMPISYASSYVRSLKYGDELFRDPKTFCMFIGYPRSGHSIVGALIDAHPDAVVSHELDVLKFIRAGFSKRQIFTMILRTSEGYARRGRVARDYTYRVPNQWHGRFRNLRVIGDKKGPGSMNKLRDDLKLTDRLQKTTGTDIRYIHVIRNPYDTISTISRRSQKKLTKCSKQYFSLCRTVMAVKKQLEPSSVLDMRHEALIADPESELTKICLFLGLEPREDYLRDCASILYSSPHKSRCEVQWSDGLIRMVKEEMAEIPFLEGYSFEE